MDEISPNLELPYLQAAQAQKHVTHNAALERLDLIVQLSLQSFDETTPPSAPEEGQVWAIGPGAVNDWAGHDGKLAGWSNGGWVFITPQPGWRAALGGELRVFDGTGWTGQGLPALQNLPGVGIGTSYDGTNRLAVASESTLFNHDGAGHQIKVNKNAAGQTASLLFQTAFSGRAEMGTMGTNNFAVKVSADGSSWTDALVVAAATGLVTGAAVTQSTTDTTAGRLLTTGAGPAQAFRRGNILGTVSQSAGVPTGALIEYGSNANGEYWRYAGGHQVCLSPVFSGDSTTAIGSTGLFRWADVQSWTFPAGFSSAPVVSPAGQSNASTSWGLAASPSTVSVALGQISTVSQTARAVRARAEGRWF